MDGNVVSICVAVILTIILLYYYEKDAVIIGLVSSIAAGLMVSVFRHMSTGGLVHM
jgi:hypothetical protein